MEPQMQRRRKPTQEAKDEAKDEACLRTNCEGKYGTRDKTKEGAKGRAKGGVNSLTC